MNILVTGGAGYIGSHAVRHLIQQGHKVVVIDNLSTGHREAIAPEACFVQGNVSDENLVKEVLINNSIDAVMHFAAHIEVAESVEKPYKYYANNFSAALSFIKYICDFGIQRFVFSSTAAVYGNPVETPIKETHQRAPLNPYGKSKMMVEDAIHDFARAANLGFAVLRYFNVAGAHPDGDIGEAHQPESHLIPRVLQSAMSSQVVLPIYGTDYPTHDGTCVRDYVHVQDLVRAHSLALEAIKPGQGQVYNLGSENGFSVLEVIQACQKVTGASISVEKYPRRAGDAATLVASSEKIRNDLGWKPQYPDVTTIIEHAWKWHQKHPHGYALQNEQ
ncbi:MAG: UDP-glucose 4-epimerase GalE [Bdellovibrionota bacterium]